MKKRALFNDSPFNNLPNYISYYYQIKLIPTKCKNLIEIGSGNKFIYSQLKLLNKKIICVDINKQTNPDIIANVKKIPVKDNSVDCVLCYQVLEHLPLNEFEIALKELKRITKEFLIISLPFSGPCFGMNIYSKFIFSKGFIFRVPLFFLKRSKKIVEKKNLHHYWTVGEVGASKRKIKKIFNKIGFKIIKEHSPILNSHHIFWVLKKDINKD